MRPISRLILLCVVAQANPVCHAALIAFLKGNAVFLAAPDGHNVRELQDSPGEKWALQWLPDGKHLSYLTPNSDASRTLLVVLDLNRGPAREVSIGAKADPRAEGMRSVEELAWVSMRLVRLEGRVSPKNCEVFEFDIETKRESYRHAGPCGTFAFSRQGGHIAYHGMEAENSKDDPRDTIEIDGRLSYAGRTRVLTEPVWSPDGKEAWFVEAQAAGRGFFITRLAVTGKWQRKPIPTQKKLGNPTLVWIGSHLVLQSEELSCVVDRVTNICSEISPDVQRDIDGNLKEAQLKAKTRETIKKQLELIGGREPAFFPY